MLIVGLCTARHQTQGVRYSTQTDILDGALETYQNTVLIVATTQAGKRAMSDDITAIIAGTLTTVWVYVIFSLAPLVVIAKGAIAFLTVVVIASLLYAAYYRYA